MAIFDERELLFAPEPTYFFNPGDHVKIGSLKNCVITECLENGKIYLVDYDREEKDDRRNPVLIHHQEKWFWYELRPVNENVDHSLIKNKDVSLDYSQRSISGLFSAVYHFGVDTSPEYQREYVWTEEDEVALIDSIFNNVDIGKFVFVSRESSEGPWLEILDGKQRLKAITDFYENRFAYKGLYFNDLSNLEKHHFTSYSVSYAELRNCSEEMKFRTFILLNTRGVSVEEDHLDEIKSLYAERFNAEI